MSNYKDLIFYLKGLIIILEGLDSQDDTVKVAMIRDVEKNIGILANNLERLVN